MNVKKPKAISKAKSEGLPKEQSSSKIEKKYTVYEEKPVYASEFEVTYGHKPYRTDDIGLLRQAKEGLDAKAALDFMKLSGFTPDEFQGIFKTTVKTIQNHVAKHQKLDAALSEKLIKCFALFDQGAEIFSTPEVFTQWLRGPAYGLGYQVPLEIMDTITGIRLVEDEIIRIEYGALA